MPIIFLTTVDKDAHLAYRGYATGASDYISKPFDPWLLRAKVQVCVDLWNAGRSLSTQADLLRPQLGERAEQAGNVGQVDVVAELRARLAGVEEAVADLDGEGERGDARRRVRRRLDELRRAIDALSAGSGRSRL